jgi:hypothetical protein
MVKMVKIDGLVFSQSSKTKIHTGLSGITQESVAGDPCPNAMAGDSDLL